MSEEKKVRSRTKATKTPNVQPEPEVMTKKTDNRHKDLVPVETARAISVVSNIRETLSRFDMAMIDFSSTCSDAGLSVPGLESDIVDNMMHLFSEARVSCDDDDDDSEAPRKRSSNEAARGESSYDNLVGFISNNSWLLSGVYVKAGIMVSQRVAPSIAMLAFTLSSIIPDADIDSEVFNYVEVCKNDSLNYELINDQFRAAVTGIDNSLISAEIRFLGQEMLSSVALGLDESNANTHGSLRDIIAGQDATLEKLTVRLKTITENIRQFLI